MTFNDAINVLMERGFFVRVRELPDGGYEAELTDRCYLRDISTAPVPGIAMDSRLDALRNAVWSFDSSGDLWAEVERKVDGEPFPAETADDCETCGKPAQEWQQTDGDKTMFVIECSEAGCDILGVTATDEQDAIKMWNRRQRSLRS